MITKVLQFWVEFKTFKNLRIVFWFKIPYDPLWLLWDRGDVGLGYKCAYLEALSPSGGAVMGDGVTSVLAWPHIFYLLWSYAMFSFTSQITVHTDCNIPVSALFTPKTKLNQAQIFYKSESSQNKNIYLLIWPGVHSYKCWMFNSLASNPYDLRHYWPFIEIKVTKLL